MTTRDDPGRGTDPDGAARPADRRLDETDRADETIPTVEAPSGLGADHDEDPEHPADDSGIGRGGD